MDTVINRFDIDSKGFNDKVEQIKKKYADILAKQNLVKKDLQAWQREEKRLSEEVAAGNTKKVQKLEQYRKKIAEIQVEQKKLNKELSNTGKELDKAEKGVNKFGKTLSHIGKAMAAAFAVHKIIEFAKQSVEAFAEEEMALSRMTFALNNNKEAAERMIEKSRELSRQSLFSKEDIQRAIIYALEMGKTETQANKMTVAAMGLSRVTGKDLTSSMQMLAATQEGVLRGMTRYDGRLKDLTPEQLKAGAAIDMLSEKLGKFGTQGVDTAAGKIDQMNKSIRELKEQFGAMIVNTGILNFFGRLGHELGNTAFILQNKGVLSGWEKFFEMFRTQGHTVEKIEKRLSSLRFTAGLTNEEILGLSEGVKAIEEAEKKADEIIKKREENRKKAAEAAKKYAEIEKEGQDLILQYMTEGFDKQIALENDRFKDEQEKYKGHKEVLQAIELEHQRRLAQIRADAYIQQANTDNLTYQNARDAQTKANQEKYGIAKKYEGDIYEAVSENNKNIIQSEQEKIEKQREAMYSLIGSTQSILNSLSLLYKDNAEYQKAIASTQIVIDGILATANAISTIKTGDPITYIIAATSIAAAVISVFAGLKKQVDKQTIPSKGFAEGVLDLQGPGTEKSDSIPARLSKHESVMTAEETKAHYDELKAMKDGTFDELIYQKYLNPMKKSFADNISRNLQLQAELNDERIVRKIGNTNMILIKNNSDLIRALSSRKIR